MKKIQGWEKIDKKKLLTHSCKVSHRYVELFQ